MVRSRRRWQRATPEQRQAFLANHPHFAAMLEARAARGQGLPEQRRAFPTTQPEARAQMEQRQDGWAPFSSVQKILLQW